MPPTPIRLPSPPRIELSAIVIDDDADTCAYMAALLRRSGIRSIIQTNPLRAAEVAEHSAFDMAVIDLRMGPIDGFELIRLLRRAAWGADMYCILLSAVDDVGTRASALRAGFDDVLSKKMEEVELSAKLVAARRIVARQRKLDLALTELRSLANQDPLTGLFNRRFLNEELERILARKQTPTAAILFDLNDFKLINDTYGHLAGDLVLRDVAALLMRETRAQDVLARFGGDEFVLILEDTSLEEAAAIRDRIVSRVPDLSWNLGEAAVSISVTAGIATSELMSPATVDTMIEACDRDLYKGKYLRRKGDPHFDYSYPRRDATVTSIALPTGAEKKTRQGPNEI